VISTATTDGELLEEFATYVSPQKVATYRLAGWDFVPGRREGARVWDWEGRRSWIDCRAAGGVFNLGHRPQVIIEAVKRGLDEAAGAIPATGRSGGGQRRACCVK